MQSRVPHMGLNNHPTRLGYLVPCSFSSSVPLDFCDNIDGCPPSQTLPLKCHNVPGSPLRSAVILTFQSFRIIENRYGHLQVKCLVSKGLCVLAWLPVSREMTYKTDSRDQIIWEGLEKGKFVKRKEISLSLCKQNDYNVRNLTSAKEI